MHKLHRIASSIILFPSLCFTMKQLHQSTVIHNNSGGGILKEVLDELVTADVLIRCSHGIKHSSRCTTVFIKRIPTMDAHDAEFDFEQILAQFSTDQEPIKMSVYRNSCEVLHLRAVGIVQDEVYDILRRPEYGNRDLSILSTIPKTLKCRSDQSSNSASNNIGRK